LKIKIFPQASKFISKWMIEVFQVKAPITNSLDLNLKKGLDTLVGTKGSFFVYNPIYLFFQVFIVS